MQTPLRITCHKLRSTPALKARICEHLLRLERFHHPILTCHVILQARTEARAEEAVEITIDLKVPGCEISVHRVPSESQLDMYVALRDAFDAAKRLLQDHVRTCPCRLVRHAPLAGPRAEAASLPNRIAP
jgi:ribosomal subunit interface protein